MVNHVVTNVPRSHVYFQGIDCVGHGTHTAAIVAGSTYGVAKKASICAVRVVSHDCDEDGTMADVIAGKNIIHHKLLLPEAT